MGENKKTAFIKLSIENACSVPNACILFGANVNAIDNLAYRPKTYCGYHEYQLKGLIWSDLWRIAYELTSRNLRDGLAAKEIPVQGVYFENEYKDNLIKYILSFFPDEFLSFGNVEYLKIRCGSEKYTYNDLLLRLKAGTLKLLVRDVYSQEDRMVMFHKSTAEGTISNFMVHALPYPAKKQRSFDKGFMEIDGQLQLHIGEIPAYGKTFIELEVEQD